MNTRDSVQGPLVTVCVPTTGRMEYLEQALATLPEQTHARREVLILDNASPPPAQEVLQRFVRENPDARILRVEERVPMFANFNRGVREAVGSYIVFFHDDDLYHPRFIERYVEVLERHPEAAFAGGNFEVLDPEGRVVRRKQEIRATELWEGRRFIEDLVKRGRGRVSTPGLMYRRSVFQPLGFDEAVNIHWGDFIIQMRMAEEHAVAMVHDTLYGWRVHGQNASGIPLSRSIPMRTAVMRDYCREFRERHPEEEEFAARLERHVARTHRRDLFMGWLSAPDEVEAAACLGELASAHRGQAQLLGLLQHLGLSRSRRRAVFPMLRWIGEVLGA